LPTSCRRLTNTDSPGINTNRAYIPLKIPAVPRRVSIRSATQEKRTLNRIKYQYSDLHALDEKSAY